MVESVDTADLKSAAPWGVSVQVRLWAFLYLYSLLDVLDEVMSIAIGIDLGTTNTVVAYLDGSTPQIILSPEGKRLTPSVVAFKDHSWIVGHSAKRQQQLQPQSTISQIKRLIGRTFVETQEDRKHLRYNCIEKSNGDIGILVENNEYSPQEISAMILRSIREIAEESLGETVTDAVITVPAYFDDRMRQATKDAGLIAGLNILRVINEPTAAALSYTYNQQNNKRIAVFDFGGGTFDISILNTEDDFAQVIVTRGNNRLGGMDIDQLIVRHMCDVFFKEHGIDIQHDPIAMQRIRDEAERVKIELSNIQQTDILLPFLYADEVSSKNLQTTLNRSELEAMMNDIVEKTVSECTLALEDAGLHASDIDEVVMVGGSSRIPLVQQRVQETFQCRLNKSFNPDEVVAIGAAIQAGSLMQSTSKAVTLLDVTAFKLGIEVEGGRFAPLIEKNTTIPFETKRRVTTATDNQRTVKIHVLQGDSEMAADNVSLGEFELQNIPPAPKGEPKIDIHFKLDNNGIVLVTAFDQSTGSSEQITIENSNGLSKGDIENLRKNLSGKPASDSLPQIKETLEEKVVELENLLHAHKGILHKSTVDNIERLQKSTRTLLMRSQDESKLSSMQERISQVIAQIKSAT